MTNKTFCHLSRAWYGPPNLASARYVDEVMFGVDDGELAVRWYELNGDAVPRLEVFDDAWRALASMPELVAALGEMDNKNVSPDVFCRLLTRLGFRDDTPVDDERRANLEEKIAELVAREKAS